MTDFIRPTFEANRPRGLIAGLLQSGAIALLMGIAGYLSDLGAVAITLAAANVWVLGALALHLIDNRTVAHTVLVGLLMIVVASLGVIVWQQRTRANEYRFDITGYNVLRSGENGQVTAIEPQLDMGNPNDFDLYYRVTRRFAQVGQFSTRRDNPGARITRWPSGRGKFLETHKLPVTLANGRSHQVAVEFEIVFGRTERMEKRFRYSADWQFLLVNGRLAGPVTSTDEVISIDLIGE